MSLSITKRSSTHRHTLNLLPKELFNIIIISEKSASYRIHNRYLPTKASIQKRKKGRKNDKIRDKATDIQITFNDRCRLIIRPGTTLNYFVYFPCIKSLNLFCVLPSDMIITEIWMTQASMMGI